MRFLYRMQFSARDREKMRALFACDRCERRAMNPFPSDYSSFNVFIVCVHKYCYRITQT